MIAGRQPRPGSAALSASRQNHELHEERERHDSGVRRAAARAIVTVVIVASGSTAGAQGVSEPVGRFQLAAGIGWLTGAGLGEQAADLRASSGPFRLFQSGSTLGASGSFELRLGMGLSERYGIEARFALSRPELRTTVSSDAEAAADATVVARVDQYVIDGGIAVRIREWAFLGMTPFAAAGGGYVRQLHEARALVEEGSVFYAGGGVARLLFSRPQGFIRAASVRGDVRINAFSDDFDDGARRHGSISGGIVVTF